MAEQGSILRNEQSRTAPPDDALAAVARAQEAADSLEQAAFSGAGRLAEARGGNGMHAPDIALLSDIDLHVQIELGRTRMYVEDVLRLSPGSVVELDKAAGEPVDILVNEQRIARGEVIVLNDNFCIRVTEILHDDAIERASRGD